MVANFLFNHEVNFTYKHECDSSYIDYVLIPVSGHESMSLTWLRSARFLAIILIILVISLQYIYQQTLLCVMLTDNTLTQNIYSIPRPNWNDINFQLSYGRELGKALFLMKIEACDINTYNYLHFDKYVNLIILLIRPMYISKKI